MEGWRDGEVGGEGEQGGGGWKRGERRSRDGEWGG